MHYIVDDKMPLFFKELPTRLQGYSRGSQRHLIVNVILNINS